MTDTKTPEKVSIVHKIAAPVGTAIKKVATAVALPQIASGIGKGISWTAGWAYVLSGAKHAIGVIAISAKTPSVLVVYGIAMIGVYLLGHHEEANRYGQVFGRLSSCMTSLSEARRPVSIPVCAPVPVVAPAPAVEAPSEAPPTPKAATPHKKKRPSPGLLGGLFGK